MDKIKSLERLRMILGDTEEPYGYSGQELAGYLETAVLLYSKYQPVIRMGQVLLIPDKKEYDLPEDYQLWISGLEDYFISGKKLIVENPLLCRKVQYLYYANRKLEEIPVQEENLLLDYSAGLAIENIVLKASSGHLKDQDSIAALKLGKGLDITFGTMEDLKKNLIEMAEKKKSGLMNGLQGRPSGGWNG